MEYGVRLHSVTDRRSLVSTTHVITSTVQMLLAVYVMSDKRNFSEGSRLFMISVVSNRNSSIFFIRVFVDTKVVILSAQRSHFIKLGGVSTLQCGEIMDHKERYKSGPKQRAMQYEVTARRETVFTHGVTDHTSS
ncbi:hypothetical protein TNCV_3579131 [Trichonephila clavipes]|nr:hypothetical protein TNCV_3579131 [Trichonephila clavipes]